MRLSILMLTGLVTGCAAAPSGNLEAACMATAQERAAHAAALAQTPDTAALLTGANLIETLDAACAE